MQFAKFILDLLFPPRCEVCKSIGPDSFCSTCLDQVSFLKPTAFIHSVGLYEDKLKKAIGRFKYNGKINLAKPLGGIMAKYVNSMMDVNSIDFIIPVPLHRSRHLTRGFNQSELLSQELSGHFKIPTISGLLQRTRETLPQFDLPPKERYKNVKGAFSVNNKDFIKGKKILLVDDIYTTGATISECTIALKEAQPQKIQVLTLSRALML